MGDVEESIKVLNWSIEQSPWGLLAYVARKMVSVYPDPGGASKGERIVLSVPIARPPIAGVPLGKVVPGLPETETPNDDILSIVD
jgi:hypothetical protein